MIFFLSFFFYCCFHWRCYLHRLSAFFIFSMRPITMYSVSISPITMVSLRVSYYLSCLPYSSGLCMCRVRRSTWTPCSCCWSKLMSSRGWLLPAPKRRRLWRPQQVNAATSPSSNRRVCVYINDGEWGMLRQRKIINFRPLAHRHNERIWMWTSVEPAGRGRRPWARQQHGRVAGTVRPRRALRHPHPQVPHTMVSVI